MTDLDARVAALMQISQEWRNYETSTKDFEQAIRAELQNPALHEPCSKEDAKRVIAAMGYFTSFDDDVTAMQAAIDSVLQGRALHEPVEPTIFSRALDRASKGEKT